MVRNLTIGPGVLFHYGEFWLDDIVLYASCVFDFEFSPDIKERIAAFFAETPKATISNFLYNLELTDGITADIAADAMTHMNQFCPSDHWMMISEDGDFGCFPIDVEN